MRIFVRVTMRECEYNTRVFTVQGGRQADRQNLGGFQNFSNSLKVKIFGLILFVITAMLLQY